MIRRLRSKPPPCKLGRQPMRAACRLLNPSTRSYRSTKRPLLQEYMQAARVWTGAGSQEDLMHRDECILVDRHDDVIGSASKRDAHRFEPAQPHGLLHRAFSVFLFNSRNELLLQQRAAGKITFPNVWTNTCCSHPLHGQHPEELDGPSAIADGSVPGIKQAALRKLEHELGISDTALSSSGLKFLTRMLYCAPDEKGQRDDGAWGEHEVDYILFARADVDVRPNPEEVQATQYVDADRLRGMMGGESGHRWSPWFRLIVDRFLFKWWSDLDGTLTTDVHVDTKTVHMLQ